MVSYYSKTLEEEARDRSFRTQYGEIALAELGTYNTFLTITFQEQTTRQNLGDVFMLTNFFVKKIREHIDTHHYYIGTHIIHRKDGNEYHTHILMDCSPTDLFKFLTPISERDGGYILDCSNLGKFSIHYGFVHAEHVEQNRDSYVVLASYILKDYYEFYSARNSNKAYSLPYHMPFKHSRDIPLVRLEEGDERSNYYITNFFNNKNIEKLLNEVDDLSEFKSKIYAEAYDNTSVPVNVCNKVESDPNYQKTKNSYDAFKIITSKNKQSVSRIYKCIIFDLVKLYRYIIVVTRRIIIKYEIQAKSDNFHILRNQIQPKASDPNSNISFRGPPGVSNMFKKRDDFIYT